MCTFSGLQADARVLIDKARFESQSFRFNMEDEPSLEYLAHAVAKEKGKYTQKPGVRPYGISCFFAGFQDGKAKLFQTEPSGAFNEWKANAMGRNAQNLREFLEKKYTDDLTNDQAIRLATETLLEVCEDASNMELCIATGPSKFDMVADSVIEDICKQVKAQKDAEEAKKKKQ